MYKRSHTRIIGLFIFLLACSHSEKKLATYWGTSLSQSKVDTYLQEKMDQWKIPGLSIAFINEGKVVHHEVYGYSSWEDSTLVNDQTIFEAASLSKPIFAYFVMKYVDAGKLDLDQPLYTYLHYPDIAHDERYKKITARMVLSHQSGFPNWRTDYPDNKLFIQFEPGTDFSYSGEGYQYLALVLKQIDQTDWEGLEENFQRQVCEPLGLAHTVFIQDSFAIANKAEPYDEEGVWISPERDVESTYRYEFRAPASIHSEPIELATWMIALMNREGLSAASFEQLFKAHSYAGEFGGIKTDYSLGFFHPHIPRTHLYLHGGNNYGFTAFLVLDPDKKWGFVLMTNSEYGEQLGNELTLYLLSGIQLETLPWLAGISLVFLLLLIFLFIRFLFVKMKNRNK